MRNITIAVSPIYFNIAEYCLFGIVLCVIIGIILYYNIVNSRNNDTVAGFLFAGKNMSVLSITLSLIASHLTSITLLGVPVEIYLRGTQYWASALSLIIVTFLTAVIYLPVFHKLQLSSCFEYLEIRFSPHTRTLSSVLFIVSKMMILPIVPYVPLVGFKLVTNQLAARVTAMICISCATFSAVGGLRAIVAISIGTTFLAIAGTALPSGLALLPMGFMKMWEISDLGGRIAFYDTDPDMSQHTSFFAVTLALSTNWLWKIALSQSSIQKLQAVSTIRKARLCLVFSCAGIILMKLLSGILGLAVYSWFAGCDPLSAGHIQKPEQLVPHFLNSLAAMFPGICGIFIMSTFCATCGCMASLINSIAGVLFEEFIRPWMPQNTNELACCRIMKILCIFVGLYSGCIVWFSKDMDKLQHIASGVTGITAGLLLGVFTLGMVFSRSNCSGALSGCLLSLVFCGWLLIGAETALASGALTFQGKPLVTSGCGKGNLTHPFTNITVVHSVIKQIPKKPLQSLFKIAFTYCPFAGAVVVVLVGVPMSYLTKSKSDSMNPDVFCPLTQSILNKTTMRSETESFEERPLNTQEVYVALDEALKHLKEVLEDAFFPEETVCIGTEVNKSPAAGEELLELCADAALDGVSLVAVEISTGNVVAASINKLQVANADKNSFYYEFVEKRCKHPSSKAMIDFVADFYRRFNFFERYGVDCILKLMYVATLKEHRQRKLGLLLFKYTLDLGRKLKHGPVAHITLADLGPKYAFMKPREVTNKYPKISQAMCTSIGTKKIAEALGFTVDFRVPLTEYVYKGKSFSERNGSEAYAEGVARILD